MNTDIKMNSILEALDELRQGKVIIVVDDETRENEGDFIAAASTITPEVINFMTMYGRGLVCAPITQKRAEKLELSPMVGKNTDPKETAFTVSIDLLGHGITTGISAFDRAKTIKALVDEDIQPRDFARPGHIFPLIAKKGGVLKRDGHTEATVDLLQLAGLPPAGVLVEIMNEDGTMARLPQLMEVAEKFNLKIITIEDLIAYRLKNDSLIEKIDDSPLKTHYGSFRFVTYRDKTTDSIHFALVKGDVNTNAVIPVRVKANNACIDIFRTLAQGEVASLEKTMQIINDEGKGAVIFINNPIDNSQTYKYLQDFKDFVEGKKLKPIINTDDRDLGIGAQIIKDLGIQKMKLLTRTTGKNFPILSGYGIVIAEQQEI